MSKSQINENVNNSNFHRTIPSLNRTQFKWYIKYDIRRDRKGRKRKRQ